MNARCSSSSFNIKNKTTLDVKGDVLLAGANLNSGGTVEGNIGGNLKVNRGYINVFSNPSHSKSEITMNARCSSSTTNINKTNNHFSPKESLK
jgi:hypothetical protein